LQFAIAYIKAKVEPIEMEKEVVSVLEETWVKATGLPRKAEVIKEISHLIGDPQDVDERASRMKMWSGLESYARILLKLKALPWYTSMDRGI
jgi:hypothetical protein